LPIEIPSEADIRCSAEQVFDLIIDFGGQDRWLARSSAFHGTEEVSSNPVALGSTYREPGPLGVRNGTVTEFERPTKLTFHQPMTVRLGLGTIDVTMRYTLAPGSESTHVCRVVTIEVPWSLKLLQPAVVRGFRVESARTLLALKAYADELSA
jgi:Polyketide cyclase / dehydrase and lipid transport